MVRRALLSEEQRAILVLAGRLRLVDARQAAEQTHDLNFAYSIPAWRAPQAYEGPLPDSVCQAGSGTSRASTVGRGKLPLPLRNSDDRSRRLYRSDSLCPWVYYPVIWRRTAFTNIAGNVEIAPDDWTLLDPSGESLARL
jgi:hypothetical protein